MWFCRYFMEPVIGSIKWKRSKARLSLRKFATPSDEAFAMLVYENNYDKWYNEYDEADKNNRTERARWTDSGNKLKTGYSNKKFCGWSREGLEQMNHNYKTTVKDRKGVPGFDRDLLALFVKEKETEANKKIKPKGPKKPDEMEGFQVLNSLGDMEGSEMVNEKDDNNYLSDD